MSSLSNRVGAGSRCAKCAGAGGRAPRAERRSVVEVSGRGGLDAGVDLQVTADTLRAASKERAGAPGTPAETELLDLLDGIIIGLARGARGSEAAGDTGVDGGFRADEAVCVTARGEGEPSACRDADGDRRGDHAFQWVTVSRARREGEGFRGSAAMP